MNGGVRRRVTRQEVTIIRTPRYPSGEAPNAHALAERWIGSVREECLEEILIVNERHLSRVLTTYVDSSNHARPGYPLGEGVDQRCSVALQSVARDGRIERRDG